MKNTCMSVVTAVRSDHGTIATYRLNPSADNTGKREKLLLINTNNKLKNSRLILQNPEKNNSYDKNDNFLYSTV